MDLVLAGIGPYSLFAGRQKSTVCSLLKACRKQIGCRHVAHVYLDQRQRNPETYISVTYPGRWLLNYALRNYFTIDPMVVRTSDFYSIRVLNHVGETDKAIRGMIADAQLFGLGRTFVQVPVMTNSEYSGAVMFAFDIEPSDIHTYLEAHNDQLVRAARVLHLETLKARGLLDREIMEFSFSPVEQHCVTLLGQGCNTAEIARETGLAEEKVSVLVLRLCDLLECSNPMHLVIRSQKLGLLSEPVTRRRSGSSPTPAFPKRPH
ncbi:autoinducer binding domain-containing protein [Rhizobium sp. CFBP 8762]|uniref:helix-turn-helix transcriptional regulator n=1 Tax=Rhizobium sp. CFBP 8762 TaxID=2775279 RepID=UPI001782A994|nr:autoinducer binding domain-containing protein [Rhizobium sp. CFBP 8762]MBD8553481.1 autoinducer binding domain-containing protein [Rhizobium sp. CFBP 8762]